MITQDRLKEVLEYRSGAPKGLGKARGEHR